MAITTLHEYSGELEEIIKTEELIGSFYGYDFQRVDTGRIKYGQI